MEKTSTTKLTVKMVSDAIVSGLANPVPVNCFGGCARIYVCVGSAYSKLVSDACKPIGKQFQKKGHYGLSHVIYIGYDTGNKSEVNKAQGVVVKLAELGINAYWEGGED